MKYVPLLIGIFPVILLMSIGISIRYHKAYWLISGYNTMSEEKKKNVDIEKLGEFITNVLFILSGIILLATLLMLLNKMLIAGIVFSLIVPTSIYTIVRAQIYDGNTRKPDGTTKMGTKVLIVAVGVFLILTMTWVGFILYSSNKPAEYLIKDDTLRINGEYGEEIKFSDIISITMEELIPEVQYRSNGSSLGNIKKGYFRLKDIGKVKLFLNSANPPFIFINVKSGLRIVNKDEPARTKELYGKLIEAWRQNN